MNSATATGVEHAANDVMSRVVTTQLPQAQHIALDDKDNNDSTKQELRRAFTQKYRHVIAIHSKSRPSALSRDATETPSFLGFRNLMVIVLIVGNVRLMIENIQKYGVLLNVSSHDVRRTDWMYGGLLYFLVPLCLFFAYLVEHLAAYEARGSRHRMMKENRTGGTNSPTEDQQARFLASWKIIMWAHSINITIGVVTTSLVVYFSIHHPLIGTFIELHALVVWLKTASYALTNRDLRHAYLHPQTGELEALPELYAECPYPENITPRNLCYFWWAPTLIYQPVYPRTDNIRWLFVVKRLGEVFGLSVFMWVLSAQYASPTLRNSMESMHSLDFFSIMERVLKLSTISLVIWLAGFVALFQSFLNALAEVMRFADRSFYEDWWNSEGLGMYWRLWNKPVSAFFRRHVYQPLVGRGWNSISAQLVVFVLSAILHELAVGVPTHNIIGVAFGGMLAQIPMIWATKFCEGSENPHLRLLGNCVFWVSFTTLGQPLAALSYYYAWQAKYGSVSKQWPPPAVVAEAQFQEFTHLREL